MLEDLPIYTAEQLKNRRSGMLPFPGMSAEDSEQIRQRIDEATLAVQELRDEHVSEMREIMHFCDTERWTEPLVLSTQRVAERRYLDRLTDIMDHMWSDVGRLREEALARGSRKEWDRHVSAATIQAVVDAVYPLPDRHR